MKTSTCFRNKEGFPVVFAIKYGTVKWFNDISELFLFSVIKSIQEEQNYLKELYNCRHYCKIHAKTSRNTAKVFSGSRGTKFKVC